MSVWDYDKWPSRSGEGWGDRAHHSAWDSIDFHVDLGCGKVSKGRIGIDRYPAPGVAIVADLDVDPALRFNSRQVGVSSIAVWAAATVPGEAAGFYDDDGSAVLRQGESLVPYPRGSEWRTLHWGLPFDDSSIKSIVSHHFFEHVGAGFIPLIEECYRVLEPGGILRAITPLFPSWGAVADPDHKRYFCADDEHTTWDSFCGTPDNCWLESFSVPYSVARFERVDMEMTPRHPIEDLHWTHHDDRELRVALKAMK